MLLMIDNYDSFTFNLVQYLAELGQKVKVLRNDQLSIADVNQLNPDYIVLSPGPGNPDQAGITLEVIEKLQGKYPILGVCLGHQAICQAFGGKIITAKRIMHGKTSLINHNQQGLFKDLNNPFEATRYHSLAVDIDSLPDCLEMTAWTTSQDDTIEEIMGVRHRHLNIQGVQFHPESIVSQHGHDLLRNFIRLNQSALKPTKH